MPSAVSQNDLTASGAEQTLATETGNDTFVLVVDTGAMGNGELLELRIYTIVRGGGTERLAYSAAYQHAQAEPIKYSLPVPSDVSIRFTLTGPSGKVFPWKVYAL